MKTNTPTKNEVKKANELVNKVVNKPKTKQLTLVQLQAQLAAKKNKTQQMTEEAQTNRLINELRFHDIAQEFMEVEPTGLDLANNSITFSDGSVHDCQYDKHTDRIMIPDAYSPHREYIAGYGVKASGECVLTDPPSYMLKWENPPAKVAVVRIGNREYDLQLSERGWRFSYREPYFG